jgi:hypothetical protein
MSLPSAGWCSPWSPGASLCFAASTFIGFSALDARPGNERAKNAQTHAGQG